MNPTPKRGSMWTCPVCGTSNEQGTSSCMNGCRQDGRKVRGPLAPPRADQPDPKTRGK